MRTGVHKFIFYSILIISILLCLWIVLFPKYKNYYLIKDINLKVVGCEADSFGDINKIKLSLLLRKEFIATTNSKRILFGGSMDEGLDGMFHKNFEVQVLLKKSPTIYLNEYIKVDSVEVTYHEMGVAPELYKNEYNLNQVIKDIKNNKHYTKGSRIDNQSLIFYLNIPKDIKIRKNDTILLSTKIDSTIIGKYLFVTNCVL